MADLMRREQTLIPVDMDQEEVALRFKRYALISAAVVDEAGRLVGMITVDDLVHIIQEDAATDALRLSCAGEGGINEPTRASPEPRLGGQGAILHQLTSGRGKSVEQRVEYRGRGSMQ